MSEVRDLVPWANQPDGEGYRGEQDLLSRSMRELARETDRRTVGESRELGYVYEVVRELAARAEVAWCRVWGDE